MIWLVLLFPLFGAIVNGLILRNAKKQVSQFIAVASMVAAFFSALIVYFGFINSGEQVQTFHAFNWLKAGNLEVPMSLILDRLSGLMLLIITGIGTLIHIYAGGYLAEENSTARFFSYLNLFVFMMLILVLGDSLPLMFVGWEGVGLCSYLLIGYWYSETPNASAGMKAFVVNRIGDIGFLIGMFLIFKNFGTLSFTDLKDVILSLDTIEGHKLESIQLITLCLFVGACGKSAQIPLYVWLPDAMAGPTPVSALIHAATMVTAGVYMMTRLNFLFFLSPASMWIIAVVGGLTALFAASIALVQTDIKKVLAYSTVSQLGFMVMACGVGAFEAGVFHLFTHACFKALLFLGAGSVIVAMHHKQEMTEMGGLKKYMPVTHFVFVIGVLAIIGFPGLSGFFSKDEILWKAYLGGGLELWSLGAVAALFTSFYMVRLLCLTFYGENRSDAKTRDHLHETPWHMWAPLIILAALSASVGYLGVPPILGGNNLFEHYLHQVISVHPQVTEHWSYLTATDHNHAVEWSLMGASVLGMLIASALAISMYRNGPSNLAKKLQNSFTPLHRTLSNKYWIDEIFHSAFISPLKDMARFLWKIVDIIIIDGIVNGVAQGCAAIGGYLSFMMSGNLHRHAMVIVIGMVCLLSALLFT